MKRGMKHGGGKISAEDNEFAALGKAHDGDFLKTVAGVGASLREISAELSTANPRDIGAAVEELLTSEDRSEDRLKKLARVGDVIELCVRAFNTYDGKFFEQLASLARSPFPKTGSVSPEMTAFLNKVVFRHGPKMSFAEMRSATGCNADNRTLRDWCKQYGVDYQKGRPGRPKKKRGD